MSVNMSIFSPSIQSAFGPPPRPPYYDELLQKQIIEPRTHLQDFVEAKLKKYDVLTELEPIELKPIELELIELKLTQEMKELLSFKVTLEEIATDQSTGSKANIISSVISFFSSLAGKIQRLVQSTFSQSDEFNKPVETEKSMRLEQETNKIAESKA